jgi:hypothetical protein
MFFGSTLSTVAHCKVVIHIPEAVGLEGVPCSKFAKGRVLTGKEEALKEDPIRLIHHKQKGEYLRSITHTFHASCGNNGSLTEFDTLGGKYNGFQAACTDLVDRGRVRAGLETCCESNLSSRRLTNTGLHDVSKVDLLHGCRIYFARLESVLEGDSTELRSSEGFKGAIEGGDWRARSGDDDDFVRLEDDKNKKWRRGEQTDH